MASIKVEVTKLTRKGGAVYRVYIRGHTRMLDRIRLSKEFNQYPIEVTGAKELKIIAAIPKDMSNYEFADLIKEKAYAALQHQLLY